MAVQVGESASAPRKFALAEPTSASWRDRPVEWVSAETACAALLQHEKGQGSVFSRSPQLGRQPLLAAERGSASWLDSLAKSVYTQALRTGTLLQSNERFCFMPTWLTPNLLTWTRVAAAPAVGMFLYFNQPWANNWAFWIFVTAAITDGVDGSWARLRGLVSPLGELLDPIADKILITVILVMLTASGHASGVASALVLSREFLMTIVRQGATLQGISLPANAGGKLKTILQIFALGFLILNQQPWGVPTRLIGTSLLWISAVVAWVSCLVYIAVLLRALYNKNTPT